MEETGQCLVLISMGSFHFCCPDLPDFNERIGNDDFNGRNDFNACPNFNGRANFNVSPDFYELLGNSGRIGTMYCPDFNAKLSYVLTWFA